MKTKVLCNWYWHFVLLLFCSAVATSINIHDMRTSDVYAYLEYFPCSILGVHWDVVSALVVIRFQEELLGQIHLTDGSLQSN